MIHTSFHQILGCFLGICCTFCLYAQNCEEPTATAYLQGNRLQAAFRNGGDLMTDGSSAQFLTPNGDDQHDLRSAIYASGLWLGGYDAGGNLHLAAQTYRQAGNDYWAGPINSSTGLVDSLTCEHFDQVWQVDLVDISRVIQDYELNQQIDSSIPAAILQWPGRGNPYYPTQLGFSLPNQDLAPFYDRNSDGIYNPQDGDYPVFEQGNPSAIADELLWTVFNDLGNQHQVSDSLALGLEIQLTAYAFNCQQAPALLQDVIFTRHRIINRSNETYHNFRAGFHVDFDLGCPEDDYVGTDAALNSIYVFNADHNDQSSGCSVPSYGLQPPVVSFTLLNQDIKKSIYNLASTLSPMGHPRDPQPAVDYYNLLSGKWVDGQSLTYGGTGYDTLSSDYTDFVFPNYPSDTAVNKWWADDAFNWAQGQDFRMIASFWGDSLLPGEVRDVDAAYAYHYDEHLTGLYNMLQLIPSRVPQIQQIYDNGFNFNACYSNTDFDAQLQGQLFWDKNQNCAMDGLDEAMGSVIVEALGLTENEYYYATSDSAGNFSFGNLPFDHYEVRAIAPSPYWSDLCAAGGTHNITLNNPNQQAVVDIALKDNVLCAFLEVDVSTPVLRHCANNLYSVNYKNNGTDTAFNIEILVKMDTALQLDSSSIPGSNLGNGNYQFMVGALAPGAAANIDLYAFLSCDAAVIGQTHCVEASISPDSLCISAWNGPVFDIQAQCLGDSIQFLVANVGITAATPMRVSLIVIEDDLMRPPIDIDVIGNQATTINWPVSAGTTYRALLNQPTGIPDLICDAMTSAFIEGCGVDSLTQIHLGYVNLFSNGFSNPFKAIDCQESIDSASVYQNRFLSGFAKSQAFPVGYGNRHFIYPHTAIDYHIRVQNTQINSLIIRDTISPHLDISSFEAGASSHPYSWKISDKGVLEFSFNDIKVREAVLDDVYIKYRFQQKPLNAPGIIIENKASVLLPGGQQLKIDPVFHEIQEQFINIITNYNAAGIPTEGALLKVYPNPIHQEATFEYPEPADLNIKVYDLLGRLVYQRQAQGASQIQFQRDQLPAGTYFYQCFVHQRLTQSGQIQLQ